MGTPLICTADERYLDPAVQWCSAVGAIPEVAPDVGLALRQWRTAPFVVVGPDLARSLAAAGVARRDRVFLLSGPSTTPRAEWVVGLGIDEVLRIDDPDRALQVLTEAVDGRGEGCLVSVIGGAGGAGASTIAAALAVHTSRRGSTTLLLDADRYGGGLDLVVGLEHEPGVRWGDVTRQDGPMTARSLGDVLPRVGNLATLSFGREALEPPPMDAIVAAALRGFEVVVADVSRQLDGWSSGALARSVLTVVVVPEDVRAVSASSALIAVLRDRTPAVVAVAAARRPGISRAALAETLGVPVLSRLAYDGHLGAAIASGAGPGTSRVVRRAIAPLLDLVSAPS